MSRSFGEKTIAIIVWIYIGPENQLIAHRPVCSPRSTGGTPENVSQEKELMALMMP
jgi:hypothetical protein